MAPFRTLSWLAVTIITASLFPPTRDAIAQGNTLRPMRLIVPFPPGGAADLLARSLSDPLSKNLGQQVVVVNRDGAGTIVGVNEAAHAAPDGHTLLFSGDSAIINTASGRKLPYDLFKDLQPVSLVTVAGRAIVVRRTASFNTLQDFTKYARDNPGHSKFGSTGVGGASHLAAELFSQAAGIRSLHVPYRGVGPALQDLAGGQFDYMLIGTGAAISAFKGGLLRALAVTSKERSPQLPDVPTTVEQGVNFDSQSWFGLYLTGHSPATALSRVQSALKVTMSQPAFQERMRILDSEGRYMTPQEFTAFMRTELRTYAKLIKDLNIRLDE